MGFKKRPKNAEKSTSGYFWATRTRRRGYNSENIALWDGDAAEPIRNGSRWAGGRLLTILYAGGTPHDPTFTLLREIIEKCNKVYRIKLQYSEVRR